MLADYTDRRTTAGAADEDFSISTFQNGEEDFPRSRRTAGQSIDHSLSFPLVVGAVTSIRTNSLVGR